MTTRTSRPTATASQLVLLRSAEATVQITRPWAPGFPEGFVYGGWKRDLPAGRVAFYPDRAPTQATRISYRAWADPLMLADLEARSLSNKSGQAVRGWSVARAGKVDLGMNEQRFLVMASAAANRGSLRAVEGPVSCRVKLLEPVLGVAPTCMHCKLGLDQHERFEVIQKGKWVGGKTVGAHHDPEAERIDLYFLCPVSA